MKKASKVTKKIAIDVWENSHFAFGEFLPKIKKLTVKKCLFKKKQGIQRGGKVDKEKSRYTRELG